MLVRSSHLQAKFSKDLQEQVQALAALASKMSTEGVADAQKFEAKVAGVESLVASVQESLAEMGRRIDAVEARPVTEIVTPDSRPAEAAPPIVGRREFKFDIERGGDGRIINVVAREVDPAGVSDGDRLSSIDAEILRIEQMMRADMAAYQADVEIQERYRDLLERRNKAVA